jgi:hypothetical protein
LQWSKPGGGTLLGAGRGIEHDQTTELTFTSVSETQGTLVLVVKSARQPESFFNLVSLTTTAASFENLQQPFPRRICYLQQADGRLLVRLSGTREGQPHQESVLFVRVPCG